MYRQSAEEHMHMMKLFHYVLEMDAHAVSPGIKAPIVEFADVKSVFEETLAHERRVTKSINDIVDMAIKEGSVGPAVTVPLLHAPLLRGERSRLAGTWWLNLMGRLKPGASYDQARDSLNEDFYGTKSVSLILANKVRNKAAGSLQRNLATVW